MMQTSMMQAKVVETLRKKKKMSSKNYKFMTNKLTVLRRNPSGVVAFILAIEALSFVKCSSMPMAAHKGGVGNHH